MHILVITCWFKLMVLCAYRGDAVGEGLNWKRNVKKTESAGPAGAPAMMESEVAQG